MCERYQEEAKGMLATVLDDVRVRLAYTGIGTIFLFSYTGIFPVYAGIGEICGVLAQISKYLNSDAG
jgi:hypothetical protein